MKRSLLLLAFIPFLAFGGKEEREYMTSTLTPAVKAAEAAFQKACGCGLKVVVDEKTIKSKNEMYQAKNVSDSVTEGSAKYCTDDASKKAVCQLKTLKIGKDSETKFAFAGGTGTATTDGQSYPSWDMMTPQLDK